MAVRWVWSLVTCAVMVLGLREQIWTTDPQRHVAFAHELRHANGLTVAQPEGYAGAATEDGYVFAEISNKTMAMEIRLRALDEKPGAYGASSRALSWLAGRATYVMARRKDHRLGRHYELKAFRAEGDGWLLIEATTNDEWTEPDFSVAWALLDRARWTEPVRTPPN